MKYFKSEDEFWAVFERFNALHSDQPGWETATANRLHEDFFGDLIRKGKPFFRLVTGPGCNNEERLSRVSMEKALYLFLLRNPALLSHGDKLLHENQEKMAGAKSRLAHPSSTETS